MQTSQAGACNAHHELRERLSRWLLLARDTLGDDEMALTHQMLARLLVVLTYHVVPGQVMAKDVQAGEVATVQGSSLRVTTRGCVKVDNANVVKTDITADNGVIHVIDSVVMPN